MPTAPLTVSPAALYLANLSAGSQGMRQPLDVIAGILDNGHDADSYPWHELHGGAAPNAIAGEAILQGTIRALGYDPREQLKSALRRVVDAVAAAHGAEVSFEIGAGTPPLVNPEDGTRIARRAAIDVVGEAKVGRLDPPIMGGEDFGYYLEKVPGCYIRIGPAFSDRENFPVHSSRFDFNEEALEVGAAYLARVAALAAAGAAG
ncbi:MAG: M20/M25/M40 family metallo-hydrolase [Holophagales bacterium]|nr:M20/M25/M40 family metallo-hydrolase [Holophagales bacterium]